MTRLLIAFFVFAFSAPAFADWPLDQFTDEPAPRYVNRHNKPKPKPRVVYRGAPQVLSRTPGPLHVAPVCQPAFRTVGDQALTREGAKDAAEKAFQQQARFSWGERFADVTHARDKTFECVRSSIGSIAGQVFHRCEIRARPCMAPQIGE